MSRVRLRPAHTEDDLRRIYATPHDHRRWPDHVLRVDVTVQVARWMCGGHQLAAAADLSCGNGAVLREVPATRRYFADLAPGWDLHGPLEETIHKIPRVGLFVCSETLEHLDDPDAALRSIREKTRMLVLSTPVGAWEDTNDQHYWAWSRADVDAMLTAAGFGLHLYTEVDFTPSGLPYSFGIWGVR